MLRGRSFVLLCLMILSAMSAAAQSPIDPPKKNERPNGSNGSNGKASQEPPSGVAFSYFYRFERPGFLYSPVTIEHDENGIGKITFGRELNGDEITEPIRLSPANLAGLKRIFAELSFLDSTEEYQYEKDYSHLGNVEIRYSSSGRSRTVKYNWTENKGARSLMDEYRRIGNEYIWKFEFGVASENQRLETPRMMEAFESFLRRAELSDPPHLVPLLNAIVNDERLPLITRNHASRLIKMIERTVSPR